MFLKVFNRLYTLSKSQMLDIVPNMLTFAAASKLNVELK
jgi:hypothetical protein